MEKFNNKAVEESIKNHMKAIYDICAENDINYLDCCVFTDSNYMAFNGGTHGGDIQKINYHTHDMHTKKTAKTEIHGEGN